MAKNDWTCEECGAEATGFARARGMSPGWYFCPAHAPYAEEISSLRAENEALRAASDSLAAALRVYLMAGHKEARREASVVAKKALAEHDALLAKKDGA